MRNLPFPFPSLSPDAVLLAGGLDRLLDAVRWVDENFLPPKSELARRWSVGPTRPTLAKRLRDLERRLSDAQLRQLVAMAEQLVVSTPPAPAPTPAPAPAPVSQQPAAIRTAAAGPYRI